MMAVIKAEKLDKVVESHKRRENTLHSVLVKRAHRWLTNTLHCRVVLNELTAFTSCGETPDAIGWVNGWCILVEVKTSRPDFFADKKKMARLPGMKALGHWRFYLVPAGLIRPEEIPEGWGLYETHGKTVKHSGGAAYRNAAIAPFTSCRDSEVALLVSALARRNNADSIATGSYA